MGLILPAVLDIAPVLVPVTAVCVALLTIAADPVYLALAIFVVWAASDPVRSAADPASGEPLGPVRQRLGEEPDAPPGPRRCTLRWTAGHVPGRPQEVPSVPFGH